MKSVLARDTNELDMSLQKIRKCQTFTFLYQDKEKITVVLKLNIDYYLLP